MTPLIRTAVAAAVLAAAGCGSGTADVSGKVTFQGKPVVYGTVVVIGADGASKSATIEPDGSYRVSGVALGTAKVAVSSPPPPGSELAKKLTRPKDDAPDKPPLESQAPASEEVIRNWVAIPDKYSDPNKSEITADVKSGKSLDIELK